MDLTPYIHDQSSSGFDDALLSVAVNGKIALAMRGRFFCDAFARVSAKNLILAVLLLTRIVVWNTCVPKSSDC